jgi:hypothetical protein
MFLVLLGMPSRNAGAGFRHTDERIACVGLDVHKATIALAVHPEIALPAHID